MLWKCGGMKIELQLARKPGKNVLDREKSYFDMKTVNGKLRRNSFRPPKGCACWDCGAVVKN